jgi:hypothetical protein
MKNEFIPYEQALVLKKLGFDDKCFGAYDKKYKLAISTSDYWDKSSLYSLNDYFGKNTYRCLAPLYQQAFPFFREKYNLQCWPEPTGSKRYSCRYDGNDNTGKRWVGYLRDNSGSILFYNTHKEAELECLKKLIEIVKNK